jgi:hypothetical protein
MLAGGAFLTTAGPATAATGGTNVCMSLSATENYSTGLGIGTLSGCHQQGSGTWSVNLFPIMGPNTGSITWQAGQATSEIVLTLTNFVETGGACGSEVTAYSTITVTSGPYEGSNGSIVECADLSNFLSQGIITVTNLGPITI